MNPEQLPQAVEALYASITKFVPLITAIQEILNEFDVTESALRARFERHYRMTPEEVAQRHRTDDSISTYLKNYKRDNADRLPGNSVFYGRRFYMRADTKFGKGEVRWFRFLSEHGYLVRCVDEMTHIIGEVFDSEIIDDIARQVGWKRWSDWPDVGRQPSTLFADNPPIFRNLD